MFSALLKRKKKPEYHPNPAIMTYSIGDELILFDERCKQLIRINPSAALIWNELISGSSVDKIASLFKDYFNLDQATAKKDIEAVIAQWVDLDLFNPANNKIKDDQIDHFYELYLDKKPKPTPHNQLSTIKTFSYLDSTYSISTTDTSVTEQVLPLVNHFPDISNSDNIDHPVCIFADNGEYEITEHNKLIERCKSLAEVTPIVNAHILVSGYLETNCISVFHAGVIGNDDGVVVLSASSGSGKSTLTAALMAQGQTFFTDEVAILTKQHTIRPAPGCIGLKPGSWPKISEFCPELNDAYQHFRQDGKYVKYLAPKQLPKQNQYLDGSPAKAIVFPKYSADHKDNLIQLDPVDALIRLTDAGYHTNLALDEMTVKHLIDWIQEVPAYELLVNDLAIATASVKSLL